MKSKPIQVYVALRWHGEPDKAAYEVSNQFGVTDGHSMFDNDMESGYIVNYSTIMEIIFCVSMSSKGLCDLIFNFRLL